MTRLLLVPHAETDWNAARRYQGHADMPLNERGRRQAAQLSRRLSEEKIDRAYASDLRRAWETASASAAPEAEPRLRELHFGAWEGLTYAEVKQAYPEVLTAWEADPTATCPPGGETLHALAARLQSFLDDIVRSDEGRTVLLVAHRGSLRVFVCLALGLPVLEHWRFHLELASLSILELAGTNALTCLNDTTHLHEEEHAG